MRTGEATLKSSGWTSSNATMRSGSSMSSSVSPMLVRGLSVTQKETRRRNKKRIIIKITSHRPPWQEHVILAPLLQCQPSLVTMSHGCREGRFWKDKILEGQKRIERQEERKWVSGLPSGASGSMVSTGCVTEVFVRDAIHGAKPCHPGSCQKIAS